MAHPGRLDELNRKFDENPRRYFAPLANEHRKAGELDRAIELCRSYLPHQPAHMSGYIVYGQSLFDAGRADEAAEIFLQALSLDPENLIALRHLGDIARAGGDMALATRWYSRVLELDPKNEEVTAYLAELAAPGTFTPPPPAPSAPPAVRPEPEPHPEPVALAELMEEPDAPLAPLEVPQMVVRQEDFEQAFEIVSFEEREANAAKEEEAKAELAGESAAVSSPFVTETMAELYVQQGFTAEALDVYRKLAVLRDEPRFHDKVRELEARLNAEVVMTKNGETVREFFARIGARHPVAASTVQAESVMPSQPTDGLSALFGMTQIDARDAQAAALLAGAFTGTH